MRTGFEENELKKSIKAQLLGAMDFSREVPDEEMFERIDEEVLIATRDKPVDLSMKKRIRTELFHAIRKLDVLQELIDDPDITEIMVNGKDRIFIEKDGRIHRYAAQFETKERLEDVIQQMVGACNRVVNEASPIVDARLMDGSRINIVLPPVSLDGATVTIRKFPKEAIRMEDLIAFGSLPEYLADYLSVLVKAGYNIFIAGGTGSGKTTFLNALSDHIPQEERIITIEDNAELQIKHIPNLVRLEARNANVEGCKEITIRDLIKSSLRMRPDRIVVGEVRGAEAIDMVQCMNTGHDGSMSTGHSNSAYDMLSRLETMILMGMELPLAAIRAQIASAIDIVVYLGRLRDRTRKLLEICEVEKQLTDNGTIRMKTLFAFAETGEENGRITGEWRREHDLENQTKLRASGLTLPAA